MRNVLDNTASQKSSHLYSIYVSCLNLYVLIFSMYFSCLMQYGWISCVS